MPLVVQKFGGTSVANSEKILSAARKAVRAHQQGNRVVMVVSAMGKNTDQLVTLASEINEHPPAREMDMLLSTGEQVSVALMAMAIDALGEKAVSLTGTQIGIKTDSTHTKARIKSISTNRMERLLDEGNIVIAAGFQGSDEDLNITTLGRGGSDTTAVALAAVLQADACEIYTDVDGVYTTDPRHLPEARMARQFSYDEMLELASLGAGVMHSRSIEFAKKFSVPIHVRGSFSDRPGTLIIAEPEAPDRPVSGAALEKNEARITIRGVPDRPGISLIIFSKIADQNVTVDMIVQNVGAQGKADISFTVLENELPQTFEAVEAAAAELGAESLIHDDRVSKISVVGLGMATQTGVAERMFDTLSEAGINILSITTSEIKISVLVDRNRGLDALRLVHQEFELGHDPDSPATTKPAVTSTVSPSSEPLDVVKRLDRLTRMEDLTIDDISLDDTQGLITLTGVPDSPGIAASVFKDIATSGILVDMIVQGYGIRGRANLSFTVPRNDVEHGVEVVEQVSAKLGCGPVRSSPAVGKLSVSGIGMRSHTSVGIRMFAALARAGINVEMISTSEVRVNVAVEGDKGKTALEVLRKEFADVQK